MIAMDLLAVAFFVSLIWLFAANENTRGRA